MPYGCITTEIRLAIQPHIENKHVIDLGAGDTLLALDLLNMGARYVTAVDKEPCPALSAKIDVCQTTFDQCSARGDVAFLAWPMNRDMPGLISILDKHDIVIYLGHNFDGQSCGGPKLFEYFSTRQPLSYAASKRNSVIIYGRGNRTEPLYPEEKAAIFMWKGGSILSFEREHARLS